MVKKSSTDATGEAVQPQYEPKHDLQPGRNGFAGDSLLSFVERLERLKEEKEGITADMTEVRAEAKGMGFDTKVLNRLIAWRAQDPSVREESDAIFDLYKNAIKEAEQRAFKASQDAGQ